MRVALAHQPTSIALDSATAMLWLSQYVRYLSAKEQDRDKVAASFVPTRRKQRRAPSSTKRQPPSLQQRREVVICATYVGGGGCHVGRHSMVSLSLQLLYLADCEEAIERSYFEWGQVADNEIPRVEWAKATPAERDLLARRGYALFDGLPVLGGNDVGAPEVYFSVGISSRIILNDVIRILAHADEARRYLAAIPEDLDLAQATDEQVEAAGRLVDVFTAELHIGPAKATKVLHKKRPAFIPMLDSVVGDFLWKNFPYVLTQSAATGIVLSVFQLLLIAEASTLATVGANLRARGMRLTPVRLLDFLIWCGWKDNGFGRPMNDLWGTASLGEGRRVARERWEARTSGATGGTAVIA